jgi:hypothetical protein
VVLTEKDKEFLEKLKRLMESRELWVDLRTARPSYMVLRGTYGDKLHETFRVSRQGVRWRFQRLFNRVYVDAFETILFIETTFGTGLRDHAIRISRERYTLRQELTQLGFQPASNMSRTDSASQQDGGPK